MENTDIVEDFLNTFQLLTPKQQKIWRYLQSFARHYRNVFPSQKKIAEACKCHRDTVIQTIKKFKSLGWLGVMKRAYTSCVYFLVDKLVGVDTLNQRSFKKKNFSPKTDMNPTSDPTLINSNKYNKNDIDTKRNVQNFFLSEKDTRILTSLEKRNPSAMQHAIEDLKALEKREKIGNPAALLVSRFNHHSKNVGVSDEVKHLEISEKDKVILSRYNATNRESFLFAYEDFKSYSMIKYVGNISAFITSRFKAHLKGEGGVKKESPVFNKNFVKEILPKLKIPKGMNINALNKYIEILSGAHSKVFSYEDKNFKAKLKKAFRKWNIQFEGEWGV